MMLQKTISFIAFAFTLSVAGMSFAQTASSQIHYFANSENGWIRTNKNAQAGFSDTSKVVCSSNGAQIYFEIAAESGDFIVFDKYSSRGDYFTREIRFAFSEKTIRLRKHSRNSPTIISPIDDNLKIYDYLIKDTPIWTQRRQFPFSVPNCAAAIFRD